MPCSPQVSAIRRLPVFPAACAVVQLLAGSAHAWPFVNRSTGVGSALTALDQPVAFQADTDRLLEVFAGGPQLFQVSASPPEGIGFQMVNLPLPDYDPYPAGLSGGRASTSSTPPSVPTTSRNTSCVSWSRSRPEKLHPPA